MTIEKIYVHPLYHGWFSWHADIALIKLNESTVRHDVGIPVCIKPTEPLPDTSATVTGWGAAYCKLFQLNA